MTGTGWRNWLSGGRISAAVVLLLLLSLSASADVKVEGWRQQNYDYIISNIGDFPDYVFMTSSAIHGWEYASLINSTGTFGGGYKLDRFIVHAMKAADFDRERFFAQRDEYDPESVNCTDYCRNNPLIVSSNLSLPKATSVKEILPLERIEVYLKVDSITDRSLDISRTRMLYYYKNGTRLEFHPEEEL